jgi:hypothetical protein
VAENANPGRRHPEYSDQKTGGAGAAFLPLAGIIYKNVLFARAILWRKMWKGTVS